MSARTIMQQVGSLPGVLVWQITREGIAPSPHAGELLYQGVCIAVTRLYRSAGPGSLRRPVRSCAGDQ